MGLDSVELLVSFEKYFRIAIPDQEAEKILSVMDMVKSVANHRGIESNSQLLKAKVLEKLTLELQLPAEEKIYQNHSPSENNFWIDLERKVGLKIPIPWEKDSAKGISRFFSWVKYKPNYDWKEITVERFAEVICFANYQTLINPTTINSQFEIYIAVAGLTQHQLGIDFFEIFPEKIFTYDFGLD